MKRQRGRNRGGGGGGGKPQQNANRAFESNGPDNLKIRGHAQHVFEKYQQLARDATSSGDRVLAENFLQHAEHYFRLLRTLQPNRPYTDIVSREGFVSGYDIDFEDEGDGYDAEPGGEGNGEGADERDYRDPQPRENRWEARGDQARGDQGRSDQGRTDQGRNDQNRNDAGRNDQSRGGYANGRNNGANNGRSRDDRNFNRERNDGQRWDNRASEPRTGDGRLEREGGRWDTVRGDRADAIEGEVRQDERRPERERSERDRPERYERRDRVYGERQEPARDPLALIEPQAAPLTIAVGGGVLPAAPTQIKSDDAKDDAAGSGAPVLRSRDGDVSLTPAFLQGVAPTSAPSDDAPLKRPRGRPRKKVEPSPSDVSEA